MLIILGVFIGLLLGLTGGGGGLVAVPVLVYGFAMPGNKAVALSLVMVGVSAFVAGGLRLLRRQTAWFHAVILAVTASITTPIGVALNERLPQDELMLIFSILMVCVATVIWTRNSPQGQLHVMPKRRAHYALLATTGLLVGGISGLFGIGGGFILVPALLLFTGMQIHRAVGTSLLVTFATSVVGIASFYLHGVALSFALIWPLALGACVGALLGLFISSKISSTHLQKGFSVFLFVLACALLGKQF